MIVAAIAIPNSLRAKLAANEASAVGSLRIINTACVAYGTKYQSFPPALANLGPSATSSANADNLIDDTLTSGQKSGYRFTYEPGPAQNGTILSYEVHADPVNPGVTGTRGFFTDQSGVIRFNSASPANAAGPPITPITQIN